MLGVVVASLSIDHPLTPSRWPMFQNVSSESEPLARITPFSETDPPPIPGRVESAREEPARSEE